MWIKILPYAVVVLSLSIHFKRILICVCPEVSDIISVILLPLRNCYFWKKGMTNFLQLLQMQGVVTFFGRVAILIDQNTQAFHMFMTALLQVIWWSCFSFLSLTKGSFVFGDWIIGVARLISDSCYFYLQLFDRSGLLYGELARFVLRLLGIRTKPKKGQPPGPHGIQGPHNSHGNQNYIEGPKAPPSGGWDNLWGDNANN